MTWDHITDPETIRNAMHEPDWAEAPAYATHYGQDNGTWYKFLRPIGWQHWLTDSGRWVLCAMNSPATNQMIAHPAKGPKR